MSKPFTKPVPPASSSTMRQQTTNQAQQPGAAAAAAPGRSGLFGGMGGMLGGLLAGGLLGSLLFGGGFSGGGFLDILLLAGLLYLAFKFFARRRAASASAGAGGGLADSPGGFQSERAAPELRDVRYQAPSASSPAPRGGMDWGALTGNAAPAPVAAEPLTSVKLPAGFDEEDFLAGAKAAYGRLNSSWDKGDLNDIAQFSTPSFMNEIREQAAERQETGRTDIMLINASLVEVETVEAEQIASVYFSVLLREDPKADAPVEVREVWHFVRPAHGEGSWKLDGIQQVEGA